MDGLRLFHRRHLAVDTTPVSTFKGNGELTVKEWHSQKPDGSRSEHTRNLLDLTPGHDSCSLPWRLVADGRRKQRSSFDCLPEHAFGQNRDSCSAVWGRRGDYGDTPLSRAPRQGRLLHLCWACGTGEGRTGRRRRLMRSSATRPEHTVIERQWWLRE